MVLVMSVSEQPVETVEVAPSVSALAVAPSSSFGHANTNGAEPALQPKFEAETIPALEVVPNVALGERLQLRQFERFTGIVGMLFLIVGLAVWRFKPHSDDRLALVILVCAMFLAILHHYCLEENRRSVGRRAAG